MEVINIVLFAIVGELGSGKTLALVYLAWNNWFRKERQIFSNINLYGFPFIKVESIPDLDRMKEGFFLGDELWLWVDCIHPDTVILTSHGVENAKEGFFRNPFVSIDFDSYKTINSIPLAQVKRFVKPKENLLKIKAENREIITSKNHRFWVLTPKGIEEIKAENLKYGDYVLVVKKIKEPKKELIEPELARLIGYIVADGHVYGDSFVKCDDQDLDIIMFYKKIMEKFGLKTTLRKYGKCFRLNGYGKLVQKLNKIGISSTKIPRVIMESNNKVLGSFLAGLFDGDGYVKIEKKYGAIELVNKSKDFIQKIKYLLLRFGIETSNVVENNPKKVKKGKWFSLRIRSVESIRKFRQIELSCRKKKQLIKLINQIKGKKSYSCEKHIPFEIQESKELGFKKITEIKEMKSDVPYLIDFTIPVYQNYVANGFVVHNSWAGPSKKQKVINAILLKSRKRGITIVYTAQSIHQVGKRIRDVTDFIAYPLMSVDNSYCRLEIFRGPRPTAGSRINPPIYFNCEPVFAMFNTYEEVRNIADIDNEEKKDSFTERFLPIETNPAWIRYLKERGYSDERIIKESRELQKSINPDNITSESQRKRKADFLPI